MLGIFKCYQAMHFLLNDIYQEDVGPIVSNIARVRCIIIWRSRDWILLHKESNVSVRFETRLELNHILPLKVCDN